MRRKLPSPARSHRTEPVSSGPPHPAFPLNCRGVFEPGFGDDHSPGYAARIAAYDVEIAAWRATVPAWSLDRTAATDAEHETMERSERRAA